MRDNQKSKSAYMSDEEIKGFIENYIEKSSYNYAVLIDGNWGSGKTFFIENILIPHLKNFEENKGHKDKKYKQRKIIYISLYGISSKEELIRLISLELLPFNNIVKSKPFNVASSLGKVALGGYLSLKGITLPEISIDISNLVSEKNSILIFDDLERCSMSINEVLGFINNFVEHDGIKTIIIANEKEISTTSITSNKELKYLVAASNEISFPQNEELKNDPWVGGGSKKGNSSKVEVKELRDRVDLLFGEDVLYGQIKEKLIGITIRYKPDISLIIQQIANKCFKDERIRNVVISNMLFIVEKLDYYDHQNIRTLLFCFDKFNSLIESIVERIAFERLEEHGLLEEMFRYTLVLAIVHKKGKPLPKWDNDIEITTVFIEKGFLNINSYIKGFRFIDSLILGASFNSDKVIEVITQHISSLNKIKKADPTDPLYRLNNGWWYMEDTEVTDFLEKVNKALGETPEKYDVSAYSSILSLNISLNRVGVTSIDINEVVNTMINNLNLFDLRTTFDTFGVRSAFEDEQDELTYKDCLAKLYENVKIKQAKTSSEDLNAIFNDSAEWVEKLREYVDANESKLLEQKAFLSKIDLDQLIRALKDSSNSKVERFRGPANILTKIYAKTYSGNEKLVFLTLRINWLNYFGRYI